MLSTLLFGVQRSPQRKICVGLAVVVALLGVGVCLTQGVAMGLPVTIVGLLAVAVLSRSTATHHAKVATRDQLERVTGDYHDDALRHMVDHAPHDPNSELGRVTGQIDGDELSAVVAQVRG